MRAIFIADAHLRNPQDKNYHNLLKFLEQMQGNLDALFLLGDIFEFWIGYNSVVFSEHLPLLNQLQKMSDDGCQLYYVEGNHDFNIGAFFTEKLRCTVVPDQKIVTLGQQKIFICHGDLANPEAKGYLLLRAFWRSGFLKFLSKIVPPDSAWRFGNYLCSLSRKKKRQMRDPSPLVIPYAKKSLATGADSFVCGHFHYPLEIRLDEGHVTVLGDWIKQFSYLELVDGNFTLKSYQPSSAGNSSSDNEH